MENRYLRRIYLVVICLFYLSKIVYAQNGQNIESLLGTKIIPPSPDAAALGKYGNIPVGLHTGIPEINIPLYTIRSKSLEVPISLSYHASGIRIDEMASWVGLGWSLNAGGVITRSVVGQADDNGGLWSRTVKNATQITINDIDYVRGVANGQIDIESDYYFYNFNGHSGKFIYDQNNTQTPLLIPVSPISIKYNPQGWFEVRDEVGTFYKFATVEYMSSGSAGEINPEFKSSFYLSEITSADGSDKIQFRYTIEGPYSENNDTYTEIVGPQCNLDGVTAPHQTKSNGRTTRMFSPLRLKEIIFFNGKVEFIKSLNRKDTDAYGASRLEEIKVYSKESDDAYSLRKSFALSEGYFVSGTGISPYLYRLKLTGITEKDAQGTSVKRHGFAYNETTMLPHRKSLAQDWWGFYNGETNNTSLIASETVNAGGHLYSVGNAIREPHETAMQACMLTKIVYPTGGHTEFDYEPHYYTGISKTARSIDASSGALGNTTDLLEQAVTFTSATTGWARVSTSCSDVTDGNPFFSRVTIRRQNDNSYLLNHIYDPYSYKPFNARLDKEFMVYLNAGETYELKAMSRGHSTSPALSGAAFSRATVFWDEFISGAKVMAGGLRVKEIRDFASPNDSALTKVYRYGTAENGKGTILIPPDGLSSSKQEIDTEFWWKDPSNVFPGIGCRLICTSIKLLISGRAVHELSTLHGSPVVYPEVAVYERNTSGPNGKQVFKFDVQEDAFMGTPKAYNNGRFQINESWRGGDEIWHGVYAANGNKLVKETSSSYAVLSSREAKGTKIGWKVSLEGNCYPPIPDINQFYYFDYPIQSGIKKLISRKESQYSSTDTSNFITTQTTYHYDNLSDQHQQLSRQITQNSQGDTLETKYWYAADYGSVENIPSLLTNNIIATPVKTETHRNQKIISGTVNRLDAHGKPFEVYSYESGAAQTPSPHQESKIIPAGYVKKIAVAYDETTKNINQVQLSDNINTAYLWGYNDTYPIAKVDNATVVEVAATSFEPGSQGNWNYSGEVINDRKAKTGTYYYVMGGGNITRRLAPGKYKLEYWAKGTVEQSGGTITTVRTTPANADGWIFYAMEIITETPATITLSGSYSAFIDELRLYPSTAQMTTYTYDPILGMSSSTDVNNKTTYYQYDDFGRLMSIRDEKQKILKKYEYQYQYNNQ